MSLFLELMRDGGPIMWVILFCSVVALFIFLKKVFQFHREEINVGELLRGLFNVLRRDGFVEALTLCDHTPGPAARLLAAAIRAYERGDDDIRKAVDDAALMRLTASTLNDDHLLLVLATAEANPVLQSATLQARTQGVTIIALTPEQHALGDMASAILPLPADPQQARYALLLLVDLLNDTLIA